MRVKKAIVVKQPEKVKETEKYDGITEENKGNVWHRIFTFSSITTLIALISTLIYFSGALFFYGFMEGLGYQGASLDSIFSPLIYSQIFLLNMLSGFGEKEFLGRMELIILSLIIISFLFVIFNLLLGAGNAKGKCVILKIINKLKAFTINFFKEGSLRFAFLIFPIFVFPLLAILTVIFFSASIIFTTLYTPYKVGWNYANETIEDNNGKTCFSFEWDNANLKDRTIVLSCQKLLLDGKINLAGSAIHTDSKFIYFVTNDLLLRVKDNQVITCRTKQRKDESHKDKGESVNNAEPKTCDSLYQAIAKKSV